jgi:ribonuclease E
MIGEETQTPRKRKTVNKRVRRPKTARRTTRSGTKSKREDVAAPSPTQVDVAEVTQPTSSAAGGDSATVVATTGRKRAKRARSSSRKKGRAASVARSGPSEDGTSPSQAALAVPEDGSRAQRSEATEVAHPPSTESGARSTSRRGERRGRRAKRTKSQAPGGSTATGAARERRDRRGAASSQDEERDDTGPTGGTGAKREMLINVSIGDECRIAVLHEGRLEELFIERASSESHIGNIYKGRITNIEPNIQAVFVDFGLPQNGFLHISDVQPQYFPDHKGDGEDVGRKIPRHQRPAIQKCFRRGQEVIVQVSKEGLGTKGPTLTTYLAIPGRFLVMMPGMNRQGVSRKIEDEEERRSMRDMLSELNLPSGMGFIMRTAGLGRSKRDLQRDLNYLLRLWKTVAHRIKTLQAPVELYQESDLVTRTIRDVYTTDFARVVVDDAETAKKAQEFLHLAMPRSKATVDLHTEREPLFHRYRIEEEIEKINMRHVPLPSGGSLVIDSTEALVAIDVNSGRYRATDDAEEAAFKINVEAAEEIARQLRLRDLGGLIVCDFIDMRVDRHKRTVERALRGALTKHKERAKILKMSAFGLIEMTRQRQGPSLKRNIYYDCPQCRGAGLVKMPHSVILDVMRIVQLTTHHEKVHKVTVTVASDVAFQLLNNKRAAISQIELETRKQVVIRGDAGFTSDQVDYACEDNRGRPVNAVPRSSDHANTHT